MASVTNPLAPIAIRRLHRSAIDRSPRVRALLDRMKSERVLLRSGMDRRNNPRSATIISILDSTIVLDSHYIEPERHQQIYFTFKMGGIDYFFAATPATGTTGARFEILIPRAIYEAERRDVPRDQDSPVWKVEIEGLGAEPRLADVVDVSYSGLGVLVRSDDDVAQQSRLRLKYVGGGRSGETAFAEVRHARLDPKNPGSLRLGLLVTKIPPGPSVEIERRQRILEGNGARRVWRQIALAGATARTAPRVLGRRLGLGATEAPELTVVRFNNERGQPMTGLIDRVGKGGGGPAVVIPPAWGRTKETLLPLALTIAQTFRAAGERITILRFDGTQRRGESFVDPENRQPGDESIGFTFAQAARDVQSAVRFVRESPEIEASRVVLVTFSLAAIDGRRAVSSDTNNSICGWVSAVGMVDVQSGLRSVSGGVDYVYGAQRGVAFGIHELGGVTVDIDRAAKDVLETQLGGFEDARRDMSAIKVPVTWIHGRDDGWMDVEQVRSLVSSGTASNRKLIEVPTGHQLRTSRAAVETFQLIAEEVSEMALGRRLQPRVPDLADLSARQSAERNRRPRSAVDLRDFWRDYLVGRDEDVGIELLSSTSTYRTFMSAQLDALAVIDGSRILDLGCGTGDLEVHLATHLSGESRVRVTAVDFVIAAIRRARSRTRTTDPTILTSEYILADLDCREKSRIPLRDGAFDAVIASLLISYLKHPEVLLAEAWRLLRPGGRLVISSPRRDADLSKLYTDMMVELTPDRVRERFGPAASLRFDDIQRRYLNEAARLVTLEETGEFRFRDPVELTRLVRGAGFDQVETQLALGNPPQTVILAARRI